jgi:hypothetical protein
MGGRLRELRADETAEVVALLEDLMEQAKAGRITSIAVAAGMRGRRMSSVFFVGHGDSRADLNMAMDMVKHRLLTEGMEEG